MTTVFLPVGLAAAAFVYATVVRAKLSSKSKTTFERLLWAAPALAVLVLTPFLYDPRKAGTLLGVHGWGFSWVGSSKIVAVAIQTSPLAADATASQFLAHLLCLCVPVDTGRSPGAQGQTLLSVCTRLFVTGSLAMFLFAPLLHEVATGRWSPHPTVEIIVDCGILWTLLDFIFTVQALLCFAVGIRTELAMRNPLASNSLQEFWARRWNLPTSSVLRSTCYEPIIRAFAIRKSSSQPAAPNAVDAAPSTPALSTQHDTGTATTSVTTSPTTPDTSTMPGPSRYNLRSRTAANSVKSTASSTPVPANSSTPKNGKGVGAAPSPVDTLTRHPVATDSQLPRAQTRSIGKGNSGSATTLALAKTAGSCLAFCVSGAAHHVLINLFSGMPMHDVRFAMLFWIQPPCIALQDAWTHTSWWRSIQCQKPLLARFVQWTSTMILLLVPMWYLMRNPFMDNPGGRAFVRTATSEVGFLCYALLPSTEAFCATPPPVIKLLDTAFGVVTAYAT